MLILLCVFALSACNTTNNGNNQHTIGGNGDICEHSVVIDAAVPATCKDTGLTEGSHCSVCKKTLVEQVITPKLDHVYNQKKTTSEYIKTKATASAPATYYYSCICGRKGTTYFSYGSPVSDNSAWTPCYKTVYGIARTYFYEKENSTTKCGGCDVGYAIKVVATNGFMTDFFLVVKVSISYKSDYQIYSENASPQNAP